MKAHELARLLLEQPDIEVNVEYRYHDCTCGPEEQYCYCGYTEEREGINAVLVEKHDTAGRALSEPVVVIRTL